MRPIVTVLEQAALVAGGNPFNPRYLGSKREPDTSFLPRLSGAHRSFRRPGRGPARW